MSADWNSLSISNLQDTGLVFIGLGLGQCVAVASQPFFNRLADLTIPLIAASGDTWQYQRPMVVDRLQRSA